MLARVVGALRGRPVVGVLLSLAVHVLVIALVLLAARLPGPPTMKRGEPLFVELPEVKEQGAPRGNPAAPPGSPGSPPPVKATPPPRPRVAARAPAPAKRPSPPAVPRAAPPSAQTAKVVAPPPTPRVEEPAPAPDRSASEPSPPSRVASVVPPSAKPEASPPAPPPAPSVPRPAGPPASGPPAGASATGPTSPGPPGPQVAALPPGREPGIDIRSALRGRAGGGGGGGTGSGRGGIVGEPIPLESPDPDFQEYLQQLRRKIYEAWYYPCVREAEFDCKPYSTSVVILFGILRDGRLQFLEIEDHASHSIYEDAALNAIRLASPFRPVPPKMLRAMRRGSTGVIISAHFIYRTEVSAWRLLR